MSKRPNPAKNPRDYHLDRMGDGWEGKDSEGESEKSGNHRWRGGVRGWEEGKRERRFVSERPLY